MTTATSTVNEDYLDYPKDTDRVAFQLGIDHARFNLRRPRANEVPPDFLLGYSSYTGKRRSTKDWAVKKWLALQLSALKRNIILTDDVTPDFLRSICPVRCPVTLKSLTHGTRSNTDCSIDRLTNNGGYARANLVAMSALANHAKAELSFEEVKAVALSGKAYKGLTPKEWARLLTLMFGAAVSSNGNRGADIIPLCTALPDHIFITPTQLLQEALLADALERNVFAPAPWRQNTKAALGTTTLYDRIVTLLKRELETCTYPYDAWYRMTAFDAFVDWFKAMQPTIALAFQRWNRSHLMRNTENFKYIKTWAIESSGKRNSETQISPPLF